MRGACCAIAVGLVVMIAEFFGPGAQRALAQGALGAGGTAGPRVMPGRSVPASRPAVRRYYFYDYATRRYYYYDVPVTSPTYTYSSSYGYVAPRTSRVSNRARRDSGGFGAQGTDGRTSPDEWMGP